MEDEEEECCVPALVDLPSKAIQISAGDSHTAALTEDGHVYIWGKYIYYIPYFLKYCPGTLSKIAISKV